MTEEARGELVKLVCGDDLLAPEALASQVAAFDAQTPRAARGEVVMVASARDIVDASGRVVIRGHGLGGLSGRVPGREAIRRSVLRGANIFGEPCCVLLRRSVLEAVGGWHGDPGYLIDQSTYCRVLLHGDLAIAPGTLAAFRLSSTQWSVALAREQARSVAEMHRQVAELAPGLLSSRDLRVGNARARVRAFQRRLVYLYLGRRMQPPAQGPESGRLGREQAELVVEERLPRPAWEREAEPRSPVAAPPRGRGPPRSSPVANHTCVASLA